MSEPIITELAHTLEDPYFRQRRTTEQIAADIALLREKAVITAITVEVDGVATHPEDDLVLATVVPAQADYLVTGDTKLQRLGSYQRVTIVSPRQFLNILTTQAPPEEETE